MFLIPPKPSLKMLIGAVVVLHFGLQILGTLFQSFEVPLLAAFVYVVGGGLDLLVASHILKKAVKEKSRRFLNMGMGIWLLGLTLMLLGLGRVGLFGAGNIANVNLAYYLVILGFGIAGLFFHFSHTDARIRSVPHRLLVGTILMITAVAALYKFHGLLPPLYVDSVPTLVRQQLLTLVLLLFCINSARFSIDYWQKASQAWQWYVISLGIIAFALLDFLLSIFPGDEFSWAGRFMTIAATFGFVQYLWWTQKES